MSWAHVKKINSNLSTPLDVSINKIDTNVGQKTDTAGTSATSSLFSWVKQMFATLSSVSSIVSRIETNTTRGVVKSIQRGTTTTGAVTLSPINPSKAFVILNWQFENAGAALLGGYSTYEVPRLVSLTATDLIVGHNRVKNPCGCQMENSNVSWQVIEFY